MPCQQGRGHVMACQRCSGRSGRKPVSKGWPERSRVKRCQAIGIWGVPPSIVALNRGGVCQIPFLACVFVTDLVDRRSLTVELRESEVRERRQRRASTCHLGAWCRHRLRAAPNRCLRLPCEAPPLPVCVTPRSAPEIRRIVEYNTA